MVGINTSELRLLGKTKQRAKKKSIHQIWYFFILLWFIAIKAKTRSHHFCFWTSPTVSANQIVSVRGGWAVYFRIRCVQWTNYPGCRLVWLGFTFLTGDVWQLQGQGWPHRTKIYIRQYIFKNNRGSFQGRLVCKTSDKHQSRFWGVYKRTEVVETENKVRFWRGYRTSVCFSTKTRPLPVWRRQSTIKGNRKWVYTNSTESWG